MKIKTQKGKQTNKQTSKQTKKQTNKQTTKKKKKEKKNLNILDFHREKLLSQTNIYRPKRPLTRSSPETASWSVGDSLNVC